MTGDGDEGVVNREMRDAFFLETLAGIGQIVGITVDADEQSVLSDPSSHRQRVSASTKGAVEDHIAWSGRQGFHYLIEKNWHMSVLDSGHLDQSPSSRRSGSSMQFFTCTRKPTASLPSTTRWS